MSTTILLRVFAILVLLLLVDLYVFQGVKTLTRDAQPKTRLIIHIIYWVINFSLFFAMLYGMFRIDRTTGPTHYLSRLFAFFLLLFLPKLIFFIALLLEDIYRVLEYLVVSISAFIGKTPEVEMDSRRKFVSKVALFISAIPFLGVLHGITKGKYKYTVHRVELPFKDLPEEFDGFTISQISDVHSGSLEDKEEITRGIELINNQNSDLILFTGDLVNNKASEMEPWIDIFKKLSAPFGKFSVLGNHDYGGYINWGNHEEKKKNDQRLVEVHKEIGFRLLRNESVKIERNGSSINLIGVENWGLPPFPQLGDLDEATKNSPDGFNVLMSHDPSHWKAKVLQFKKHMHLTLSGHTHGMQFGIEIPGIKWSPVKYRYPEWAGLYSKGEKHLYVNRGFGYIGFPGRVGIWPEITVITLRKA